MIKIPTNPMELHTELNKWYRDRHCGTINAKLTKLGDYFRLHRIHSVVVGVSGGVDSALVLALLSQLNIHVHAVFIGFDLYGEVFDRKYIDELKEAFPEYQGYGQSARAWHEFDMTEAYNGFRKELGISVVNKHVNAQATYAMRYLAFFALAQKYEAVTIGTTNKDEMGYAGWFGKNSDMVVDIQPIADLHKFEVQEWANILKVPGSIVTRKPTGDLIDGTTDEENFGCTYDELSFFTALMEQEKNVVPNEFLQGRFEKVIRLHRKNIHKYQGQNFNPVFI